MADVVMPAVLVLVVFLALWQDLGAKRIPNTLCLGALVAGLLGQSILVGAEGFLYAIAGAAVGLACLLPLYLGKGMGAGDVKLMTATGAFLGPSGALLAAALALIAGAGLAITIVLWRLVEPRSRLETSPAGGASAAWRAAATISIVRKERFPYAVAIAIGVVATLWLQGSLGLLFSAFGIG